MPLNEREQKILEEIERQFYEDDPKLAETVANTTLESVNRRWNRLAIAGVVLGFIIMLATFTSLTYVAAVGFLVMVASAGWLAMNMRRGTSEGGATQAMGTLFEKTRRRWQRDR